MGKLDHRIDADFFDRMSGEWRAEQGHCLREIDWHSAAGQTYLEEGIRVLELAKKPDGCECPGVPRLRRAQT